MQTAPPAPKHPETSASDQVDPLWEADSETEIAPKRSPKHQLHKQGLMVSTHSKPGQRKGNQNLNQCAKQKLVLTQCGRSLDSCAHHIPACQHRHSHMPISLDLSISIMYDWPEKDVERGWAMEMAGL